MPGLTMGFVLQMSTPSFDRGLSKIGASFQDLGLAKDKQARQDVLRVQKLARLQQASFRQTALSAVGTYASMRMLWGMTTRLSEKASDYQYQTKALSAMLREQDSVGREMYITFRKLNPSIKEFAPTTVVARMKDLAMAGYDAKETMASLGAILDATTASFGEMSSEAMTSLGINLHRGFGTATRDMRNLLDTAVQAANKFPMTIGNVSSAMGYATEASVIYKQSLDDTLVAIGMLVPVVKSASKAGTAYRNTLMSLTNKSTIAFLEKYGIAVKDTQGKMRSMLDIYIEIDKVLASIEARDTTASKLEAEVLMKSIGGVRGGAIIAALRRAPDIATGDAGTPFAGKKFADAEAVVLAYRLGMASATGESKRLADELRETSKVLGEKFTATLEQAQIAWGEFFRPVSDELVRLKTAAAGLVADWMGGGVVGPGGPRSPLSGYGVASAATGTTLAVSAALAIMTAFSAGKTLFQLVGWINNPVAMIQKAGGADLLSKLGVTVGKLTSSFAMTTGVVVGLATAAAYAAFKLREMSRENTDYHRKKLQKELREDATGYGAAMDYFFEALKPEGPSDEAQVRLAAAGGISGNLVSSMYGKAESGMSLVDVVKSTMGDRRKNLDQLLRLSPDDVEARTKAYAEHDALAEKVLKAAEEAQIQMQVGALKGSDRVTADQIRKDMNDRIAGKYGGKTLWMQPLPVQTESPAHAAYTAAELAAVDYAKAYGSEDKPTAQRRAALRGALLGDEYLREDPRTLGKLAALSRAGVQVSANYPEKLLDDLIRQRQVSPMNAEEMATYALSSEQLPKGLRRRIFGYIAARKAEDETAIKDYVTGAAVDPTTGPADQGPIYDKPIFRQTLAALRASGKETESNRQAQDSKLVADLRKVGVESAAHLSRVFDRLGIGGSGTGGPAVLTTLGGD